jgi:hypothetical protein
MIAFLAGKKFRWKKISRQRREGANFAPRNAYTGTPQ